VTETTGRITYYAIIGVRRIPSNPSGLVRRRHTTEGRVDEALQRDLTWGPTSAITQWEYGNLPGELSEISGDEAEALIERFRDKWAQQDS
jgi:hypothetical protein